ncbi:MAG TPA: c-type cytochrome, partial [Opitutus sp.]|nr:c-type cytochrome [Opitutus sp.]
LLVSASGLVPVKASSGHWAITEWFLHFSMQRSLSTHSLGIDVPPLDDPALVLKGATHYEVGCRSCHGAPGERRPRVAQAMLPPPPALVPRIQKSNPKKLFQAVKHGLKFTGMPAWPSQQRDDEVWAVVAFLLKLPELDAAAYRQLVGREPERRAPLEMPSSDDSSRQHPATVIQSCVRCHGADGLGRDSAAFPKLAGQRREYLENALLAYADGRRHSGIMEPIAAALDPAAIRQLATYYAQLARPAPAASRLGDDVSVERGRLIARDGIPSRRIPACIECHGPNGRRTKDAYPSLAGQPADYLVLQLELFKEGRRGGSPYAHLMEEVAPRLEPDEMRDVARYFEALRPAP